MVDVVQGKLDAPKAMVTFTVMHCRTAEAASGATTPGTHAGA